MAELSCLDGSVLALEPVPVRDRGDVPYEVTLRLRRDGAAFGEVGERCAGALAVAADRLREAAAQGRDFPADALRAAVDGHEDAAALRRHLPREQELLALRARDPDDVATAGELRVWLRHERQWLPAPDDGRGRWVLDCVAVVDAWGAEGTGVRAVLDSAGLLALLEALLRECGQVLDPDGPEPVSAGTARRV